MKFGINAQVIIALLGALYILMVCKEKYRIEYAEGEPVAEDEPETIVIGGQEAEVSEKTTEPLLATLRPDQIRAALKKRAEDERELANKEATAVKKVEKNGKKLTMKERAIADKEAAARAGVPRSTEEKFPHKGPRLAVMPRPGSPGSADFIVNKVRRADEPRPLGLAGAKAKKTSVAKAPVVAVKAEKKSIIEEEGQAMIEEEATVEEEGTIEGQAMIEEGMSTGAIAGITAVSIVALIAIMIMMRRLRR